MCSMTPEPSPLGRFRDDLTTVAIVLTVIFAPGSIALAIFGPSGLS